MRKTLEVHRAVEDLAVQVITVDRRAVEKAPLAARLVSQLTGRPLYIYIYIALLCSILILRRGVVLANIYI